MSSLSHFTSVYNDHPFLKQLTLEKTNNQTGWIFLLNFGMGWDTFFNIHSGNGCSFYAELKCENEPPSIKCKIIFWIKKLQWV